MRDMVHNMESSFDNSDTVMTDNEFICPSSSDAIYDLRNASYDYISSMFFYSDPEQYFILTFFPLLLIFGLIGNISFFVVVARVPGMRTITNAYLTNLAVCDVLFIFFSMNDVLLSYLISPTVRTKLYFSNFGCGAAHTLLFAVHFAADCIIVFMSFERYLAICKPLKHKMMAGAGRTMKLIIISWVFGVLYSVLIVSRFTSHTKICVIWPYDDQYNKLPRYIESCESSHPVFYLFNPLAMSVPYFTAFLINCILYCLIIRTMHARARQIVDIGVASEEGVPRVAAVAVGGPANPHIVRNKVAILLIATGTTYFLCFLPYIILRLNWVFYVLSGYKIGFTLTNKQFWTAFWAATALGTLNSVVNPVIYSLTNTRYRNAFKQVFSCNIRSEWNN